MIESTLSHRDLGMLIAAAPANTVMSDASDPDLFGVGVMTLALLIPSGLNP